MSNNVAKSTLHALLLGICAVIALDIVLNLLTYTGFTSAPFSSSENGQKRLESLRMARVYRAALRKPHGDGLTNGGPPSPIPTPPMATPVIAPKAFIHHDALPAGEWAPSTFLRHGRHPKMSSQPVQVGAAAAASAASAPTKTTSRALLASLDQHFPRYNRNSSALPAWILTPGDRSHTHRFFDSMPLSPTGRYLALTRAPDVFLPPTAAPAAAGNIRGENSKSHDASRPRDTKAEVTILDLRSGTVDVAGTTAAWGAQLGAQVQWGGRDADTALFFNVELPATVTAESATESGSKAGNTENSAGTFLHPLVTGVLLNPLSTERRLLKCPLYHVSPDGLYTVAPEMSKIRHTQMGYGADYIFGADGGTDSELYADYGPHQSAPENDGIYVNDLLADTCTMVISLKKLAELAGIGADVPVYGFHTKWSPDGQLLLVVIRSLEPRPGIWSYVSGIRVRRQHLFVMNKDGSRPMHLQSWSSLPFRGAGVMGFAKEEVDQADGNHPNWAPAASGSSHRFITMNMRFRAQPGALDHASGGAAKTTGETVPSGWQVVLFDVDAAYKGKSNQVAASVDPAIESSHVLATVTKISPTVISNRGTGHPLLLPGYRYLLLDAYAKEMELFDVEAMAKAFPGTSSEVLQKSAPLRLVDTQNDKEVWLLRMQLHPHDAASAPHLFSEKQKRQAGVSPHELTHEDNPENARAASNKHKRAWRCDMHPVLGGPDNAWVVLNGRPDGAFRQVVIAYVGSDLGSLFNNGISY